MSSLYSGVATALSVEQRESNREEAECNWEEADCNWEAAEHNWEEAERNWEEAERNWGAGRRKLAWRTSRTPMDSPKLADRNMVVEPDRVAVEEGTVDNMTAEAAAVNSEGSKMASCPSS